LKQKNQLNCLPLGNVLMATTTDEYFSSGLNVTNGQVIKTEGTIPTTTQYFNGNANQFNSNQQQQTFTFDNIVYNTTSKIFIDLKKFLFKFS
jgi:hypothetical protein